MVVGDTWLGALLVDLSTMKVGDLRAYSDAALSEQLSQLRDAVTHPSATLGGDAT